jgi:hypothetical protein
MTQWKYSLQLANSILVGFFHGSILKCACWKFVYVKQGKGWIMVNNEAG